MPGDAGVYTILKRGDQDVAGLYEMSGPQFEGVPPHWATYVWHDDVDAAVVKAKALGAEVLGGPFDVPGVGRMAVLKDPQGAVVQLLHGTETECAQVVDSSPGSFCWSELLTTDTEGAESFYTNLVGWSATTQEMAPGMAYTSFLQGERSVGGMMRMEGEQWRGVPPHWMNYVSVDSVDTVVAKAAELGGNVIVPLTDIPGVGRFSTLQDPTGAAFSVITLAPQGNR
jgi:predicted enzyme related to lactoylglutathione lyase